MSSPYLDLAGDSVPLEKVLGNGAALRTPLRYVWSSKYDVEATIYSLQREQNVYRRLHNPQDACCDGVVCCTRFFAEATELAYMVNGDLQLYLAYHPSCQQQQLEWRVLVADISTQNFLVDSDLPLKLCDFSEASLLPEDTNMELVDDHDYTAQVDIGPLGAVMFEVVAGKKVDLLPITDDIWLGHIIERCFTSQLSSAQSLLKALTSANPPP
ncbi:hypothetical protein BDV18DRAFT_151574 [Aspergillus unguis]